MALPFKIQRCPEHLTLADYINDNPAPPCPFVGLENITEFSMTKEGLEKARPDAVTRPFYHCSLEGCYNEQGDSRQMFEHLVTYHHVSTWLRVEKQEEVPNDEADLIQRCQQLHNPKIKYKRLQNGLYHRLCLKAKIKLTKSQIIKKIKKVERISKRSQKSNEKEPPQLKATDHKNISGQVNNSVEEAVNPGSIFDLNPDLNVGSVATPDGDHQRSHPMNIIKDEMLDQVKEEPLQVPFKGLKLNNKKNQNEIKLNKPSEVKDLGKIKTEPQQDKNKTMAESPNEIPSQSTKKISLQDYQKKKKAQAEDDVHLVAEKIVRPFSQILSDEAIVKSESSRDLPIDLLQSEDISHITKPATNNEVKSLDEAISIFKKKITQLVKDQLFMYYSLNEKDLFDKNGVKKVIKIKGKADYIEICKMFSYKFQSQVKETYLALNNDSLEGIEKINAQAYGIEIEIHKYFSEKPEVDPSYDTQE